LAESLWEGHNIKPIADCKPTFSMNLKLPCFFKKKADALGLETWLATIFRPCPATRQPRRP
jgi:hypothetical protein